MKKFKLLVLTVFLTAFTFQALASIAKQRPSERETTAQIKNQQTIILASIATKKPPVVIASTSHRQPPVVIASTSHRQPPVVIASTSHRKPPVVIFA